MCSTPQKHPAATVAVCAPAGMFIGCAGAEDMLDDVKGRKNFVKKDMDTRETTRKRRDAKAFVVAALLCALNEDSLRGVDYVFMCNRRTAAQRAPKGVLLTQSTRLTNYGEASATASVAG